MQSIREFLLGKEVRIFIKKTAEFKFSPTEIEPQKRGIIRDVFDQGLLFEITYYAGSDNMFVVGSWHFIPFSADLSFRELVPTDN